MAKRNQVKYVCSSCGASSGTWSGRCNACGEWNTLQEQIVITAGSIASGGNILSSQNVSEVSKHDSAKDY